ncbi:MAG TPA: FG-GAP repeat protein [Bryobacteraceae bacterium]|nr:FG-GAP repeat protein [Bryobacteraceae bacterium]
MRLAKPLLSVLFPAWLASGLVPRAEAQFTEQGPKLVSSGSGGLATNAALSADGNTAIFGGPTDSSQVGAAWIFTRTNGAWSQQAKLLANDAKGSAHFGSAVAISADGNTAVVGGSSDNGGNGAAWIFTRNNAAQGAPWTQQGSKMIGTGGGLSAQGSAVAISADGNTVLVGGSEDNFASGAVWVYVRSGNVWSQQSTKLVGTGAVAPFVAQGSAVAISADGNTAIVGGHGDTNSTGAAWIFTRTGSLWSQQGSKLVGDGAAALALQSLSVALSGDGNTALVGRTLDSAGAGAAWVFTRSGGVWSQQGGKLTGTGAVGTANQGQSVALSGDGNTAVIGGPDDNYLRGAAWVFKRNGTWMQQGSKLVGGGGGFQGSAVALSADGGTLAVGAPGDNGGSAWIFAGPASSTPVPAGASPGFGTGTTGTFTFNISDSGGWQNLTVADVLINSVLDGRQACYVAFVPSGPNAGSVYLVDDAGDAGGPYSGMVLPGSQTVGNGQCTITGTGSAVVTSGDNLTLTLAITFAPGFSGNKVFYVASQDATSNSGWQALATWNNPGTAAAGPAVTGVTNARATGLAQTYTFTFSDSTGWQDITVANVLISSAINGVGSCYVAFVPAGANAGSVYLVDNAGDAAGPYAGLVLPGPAAVSNGQCTVSGAGSAVSAGGNTLQLTLAVTFTPGFGGNRIIYAAVGNGKQNSGWQAVGSVAVQ